MRVKNTIRSTITGTAGYIVGMALGFVTRAIFVKKLGNECTGLNGLFSNILTMLSIAETGIGTAIIVNLYKEVAKDNVEKIKTLLQFYKKVYRIIALVVMVVGLSILPFLNLLTGEVHISENIHVIFVLYLLESVVSYLLAYKRSIIYANQKNYYINIVDIGYNIIVNVLQIAYLCVFANFTGFIAIKIVCRLIENIIVTKIADKKYPYIKEKNVKTIRKIDKYSIYTRVKGLFFHRISGFVVTGTDNIIISTSSNLGITFVGLYSNYNLILAVLRNLFGQIFTSMTPGIGNLLVEKDEEKTYSLFKTIHLMNSWVYAYAAISFYFISKPFVSIWLGNDYILSSFTIVMLTINFYITGLRNTYLSFKEAAGVFYEDRYVALTEAIVNLVASLLLVRFIGLPGVFIGTTISTMVTYIFTYPRFVYKKILNRNTREYVTDLSKYLILFALSFACVYGIEWIVNTYIKINNDYIKMIESILICLVIPN